MLAPLLALFSLVPEDPRLTPLPLLKDRDAGGVVSDDGKALLKGLGPVIRIDLRTGKSVDGEVLQVGLRRPPSVFARTTSQFYFRMDTENAVFSPHAPTLWGSTADFDHLLVATEVEKPTASRLYLPVTEFDFRQRGAEPNRSWVVACPHYSKALSLRYLDARTVEAWVREPQGGFGNENWTLARYLGRRHGGDSFMRRVSQVALKWPQGRGNLQVMDGFDPSTRTFLQRAPGSTERVQLTDAQGRVLDEKLNPPDSFPEWVFRVDEARVPDGKAAWEPLAFSGNRKFWLLRRRTDGKTFLLRI